MIDQRKGNKNPKAVHYVQKIVLDFELLWRHIPKIWNLPKGGA